MNGALRRAIADRWTVADYPALAAQADAWARTRPLAGLRVLDATPVYLNTLTKYAALLAGGAEVTVSADRGIPGDPAVIARLPGFGIGVVDEPGLSRGFDVVFDCAGTHTDVTSRLGYAELTLALSNAAAVEPLAGRVPPGVQPPAGQLERDILASVRETGAVAAELEPLLPSLGAPGRRPA